MSARRVLEELDVNEHISPSNFASFVFLAPDPLAFGQFEEALRNSFVPDVPSVAHAGDQIVPLDELLPLIPRELGPLVHCPAGDCTRTLASGL